jgi:glycogen synthase
MGLGSRPSLWKQRWLAPVNQFHIGYVELGYPHPHGGGGAGTYVRSVARELVRRGHRVSVIAARCVNCPRHSWDEGVSVHRPLRPGPLHWYVSKLPGLRFAALSLRYLEEGWRLWRFIESLHRKERLSLVEFSEGGDFWHAFHAPFPFLTHLHGSRYTFLRQSGRPTGRSDWYQRRLELAFIHRARRVLSPSGNLARIVRQELNGPLPEEVILPYPLDPALLNGRNGVKQAAEDSKIILFAARSDPVKGADVLFQAVPLVRRDVPDAEFHFVGCPPAADISTAEGVRFYPFVPKEQLMEHYRRAAVCVVPSLWDNSPYTVYEAMASGKPVVACRVGGIPELIDDGATGFLVQPGHPGQLANAILRLLHSYHERVRMGQAARQRIQQLANLEVNVSRRLAVYEQLVREFGSACRTRIRRGYQALPLKVSRSPR